MRKGERFKGIPHCLKRSCTGSCIAFQIEYVVIKIDLLSQFMSKTDFFSNFESSATNNGRATITKNMGRKGVLSKTDNIKKQKKFRVGYAEQKVATYCQKSFTPLYV